MNLSILNDEELLRYANGRDDFVVTPLETELAKRLADALDAEAERAAEKAPSTLVAARDAVENLLGRLDAIHDELSLSVSEPLSAVIDSYTNQE